MGLFQHMHDGEAMRIYMYSQCCLRVSAHVFPTLAVPSTNRMHAPVSFWRRIRMHDAEAMRSVRRDARCGHG